MKKVSSKRVFYTCFLLVCFLLTSCLPTALIENPVPTLDQTALFATSELMVTEAFYQTQTLQVYEATSVAIAKTAAVTPTPIPTLARTRPVFASPTELRECNMAAPGTPLDVTIRDDTQMAPGESFTKTWRLLNAGTCKWTRMYSLVFFSGNPMDAIQSFYLASEVQPGSMIDLSVDMVAPGAPGTYQSNWMLKDEQGQLFGIGPNSDAPFWARIQVAEVATSTPEPTITVTPTPIIYLEGSISIINENQVDLDTGTISPNSVLSDLLFTLDGKSYKLSPINGAGLQLFGDQVPEFNDCRNALVSADPITFDGIQIDTYMCFRTNQGLPGRLRLLSFDDVSDSLKIDFLTWSLP